MITTTHASQVYFYLDKIDFRKGIDGHVFICKEVIKKDPFSGAIFVFMNSCRTTIRLLCYDGQGFWLCQKRLSEGKFKWRPSLLQDNNLSQETILNLLPREFQVLLWNGSPEMAKMQSDWRKINSN